MALTDDELLDFDHDRLATFEIKKARQILDEQEDVYRVQLVAARFVDGWRDLMGTKNGVLPHSDDWYEGFEYAMREVAAHLRQGDLVPGGILYDETNAGKL